MDAECAQFALVLLCIDDVSYFLERFVADVANTSSTRAHVSESESRKYIGPR